MEIKLLSTSEDSKKIWDDFVSTSRNGTIFHKSIWLDAGGGDFDIWGIYKDNNLLGGFVAPIKTFYGIKVVSAPPFTPYCGLVFKGFNGKYVRRLSLEKEIALELAVFLKKKYRRGIISFDPLITDMQPFIWQGFHVYLNYTYILDSGNLDIIWDNMRYNVRNAIRKSKSDGLDVRDAKSFDEILKFVKMAYGKSKIIPSLKITKAYYDLLEKENNCKTFVCIDYNQNTLAGGFILWDERRSYYLLSGYNPEHKHRAASSLCLWEAIKYSLKEKGLPEFDFHGSMIPKIELLFRHFGGKIFPFYEIRWGRGVNVMLKLHRFLR